VERFIYEFDDLIVDPANRRLARGGREIALEPKALSCLLVLLERASELVTREELLDAVWGHRYIAPATLNRIVTLLRRALGDDAGHPHAIMTVHGTGYRFIGAVRRRETLAASGPASFGPSAHARLPARFDTLIGREAELTQLRDMLQEYRAITVVGPGGVGKTQCVLEAARQAAQYFADGVWFFDLSPLNHAEDWLTDLALSLNLPTATSGQLMPRIVAALTGRQALIVVDNCDRLAADIGALVLILLRACPDLKLMSTSQRPLDFVGERLLWLAPLGLPPSFEQARLRALDDIAAVPSVALLLARARAVQTSTLLTDSTLRDIVEICHRLDGMPLALELAAPHLALLSPAALRDRLRERLSLLASDSAGREPRHRNLHALVEWSFGLLTEPEQQLLCWLGVFLGGWSIDALGDVGSKLGIGVDAALRLHSGLILKSLVAVDPTLAPPRYRLLETVREAALLILRERGEEALARAAHLHHIVRLAERSHAGFLDGEVDAWIARLGHEHPNIDSALRWACGAGDAPESALRLAGSLMLYSKLFGSIRQMSEWTDRALEAVEPHETTAYLRAVLCNGLNKLYAIDSAIDARLSEAAALAARLGDVWAQGCANAVLAQWFANRGELDKAQAYADTAMHAASALDDPWLRSLVGLAQGWIELRMGQPERALTAMVSLCEASFDVHQHQMMSIYVALAHYRLGRIRQAAQYWHRGLAAAARIKNLRGMAGNIEGASYVAMKMDRPRWSARFLGKAADIRARTVPLFSFWMEHHEEAVAHARRLLGDELFGSLEAAGASVRDEVVAEEVHEMLERVASGQPLPAD
jgi:predicted ATPase/DNA-binding winged helix-turn-helix (wHTH) protein